MKKVTLMFFVLVINTCCFAQKKEESKDPLPEISMQDQYEDTNLVNDLLSAVQQMQATPQYQMYMAAQNALNQSRQKLYQKYKIDGSKTTLCAGPGQPPCDGIKPHTLVWKPTKK